MDLLQKVFRNAGSIPTGIGSKATTVSGRIETMANVHALYFKFLSTATATTYAEMLTDLGRIVIRVNGTVIIDATAENILDLQKYHQDQHVALVTAGVLPVVFTRENLPVAAMNNGFALGMLGEDGVSHNVLSWSITTKSPAAMAITSGEVSYEHDILAPQKLGYHVRLQQHDRTYAATGYQDITDLPKDDNLASVLAYHFTVGNCSKITVKINGKDRYEDTDYEVLKVRMHRAGRTPQTGHTHVPFDLDNDLASLQPLGPGNVVDLLVKPYWSTSPGGAYTILAEEIHAGF